MEKHKQRYMDAILSRRCASFQAYLKAILMDLQADVRSCYSEDIDPNEESDFFDKMILDSCFIVEYLFRFHESAEDELDNMIWVRPLLFYDMLLLENQLPFFLLDYIFDHVKQHCQKPIKFTFMHLCLHFFKRMFRKKISLQPQPPEPAHLLHLCHSFLTNSTAVSDANADNDDIAAKTGEERKENTISDANISKAASAKEKLARKSEEKEQAEEQEEEPIMIPSATALQEMGITLKGNKAKGSIIDIKFNKATGVLEIPHLVIDDFTNSQFRNLIAFEQLYPRSNGKFLSDFCAYVQFMDYIVNTPEDVALLYKKGIVKHFLGCDEDVAHLFNNLNRETFVDPHHYLVERYKEVNSYRNFFWPRWRTNLMHNYFNTPWASISVAAAAFLLILSVLQTIFTGISTF